MKKYRIPVLIAAVLLTVTLLFIWSNSMDSVRVSDSKSMRVTETVTPILEIFVGKGHVSDHLVRKIAHFVEYSALGFELALIMAVRRRIRPQAVVNGLFIGLCAAVADEALQLLTGRGSLVSDVVLDFSAVCTGMAVTLLIAAVVLKCRRGRKR